MEILSADLFRSGELHRRAELAYAQLRNCRLCPRNCEVDRLKGELGFCNTGRFARVASYGKHFGEEQPLVGVYGSGTIFFASCNLHCCFCQNYDISHGPDEYQEVDSNTLASIMLELQDQGCQNINFVTPSHVVPHILAATVTAHEKGLAIPLVYNSGGYESTATLELLDGVIDIYMPDFKFWFGTSSGRYADARDYPDVARRTLRAMHDQVGELCLDASGLAFRGLLVRHLLMPGGLQETKKILTFLADSLSPATYVNLMDQYRWCGTSEQYPELKRAVSSEEFQAALSFADEAGLTRLDKRDSRTLLKRLGIV